MRARAVGNIVVYAHGEGIGLLKHHAHALTEQAYIGAGVDVLSVKERLTLDAAALNKIVHAVKALKKGGFAAAGGADKGADLMLLYAQVHIFKGVEGAVPKVKVLHRNFAFRLFAYGGGVCIGICLRFFHNKIISLSVFGSCRGDSAVFCVFCRGFHAIIYLGHGRKFYAQQGRKGR